MILTKKDTLLIFIIFILLSSYGLDVAIVAFSHDHEPVIDYEDNCPACQWEIQSKENDVYLQTIWNTLHNSLFINFETPVYQILLYKFFINITTLSPRSPPRYSVNK